MPCGPIFKGSKQAYFGKRRSIADRRISLKCGQCIGCRLDKSREWAIRCHHEAQYHSSKSFITLTFAKDPVSLSHIYFQRFLKRLRKKLDLYAEYSEDGSLISPGLMYYMCGEYGSVYDKYGNIKDGLLGRPHFHAILYGYDFPDRKFFKKSNSGFPIYNSELLDSTWKHGFATTQDFSMEAAAYVARYVTKKVTGSQAERHYEKVSPQTGEIIQVEPEYTRMSLKPAIGKRWIQDHIGDAYPKDFITANGVKFKPPKYYDKIFEDLYPDRMELIKERRQAHARENKIDYDRLATMHQHKKLTTAKLKRPL